MSMAVFSITLSDKQIADLKKLNSYKESDNPTIDSIFELSDCKITLYKSKKAVFQGKDVSAYQEIYQTKFIEHSGSDEVGTGDYFGPVVVAACFINQDTYQKIKHLGIQDSKQLDDIVIRRIAPQLMEECPYSVLIVDNSKYNQIHKQYNLNAIKALLHNQAYKHLEKKIKQLPELNVVDQFTPENLYYNYLKNEKDVVKTLHFETKAESKYLAVACASVIARYTFLQVWDKMEENYHFTFPKGSGELVDQAIVRFVKEFGKDKLPQVAKLHFKNTQKSESL